MEAGSGECHPAGCELSCGSTVRRNLSSSPETTTQLVLQAEGWAQQAITSSLR